MGYIFQKFNLIPYLTVLENVTLPLRFSPRRRERTRNTAGHIEGEARHFLEQLGMAAGDLLHRPVTNLSVGQQQRVAAACAMIGGLEILIADEPTSSLDAGTRATFLQLLFQECAHARSTLAKAGINLEGVLACREEIKKLRQKRANTLRQEWNGKQIRRPGYALPLEHDG